MTEDLPTSDLPDVTAPAAPEAAAAKQKSKASAPAVAAAPEAPAEEDAADTESAVDSNLPLFMVESNGLQSESFHAVDETDAVRQFYKHHKVADTENRKHKVTRVS